MLLIKIVLTLLISATFIFTLQAKEALGTVEHLQGVVKIKQGIKKHPLKNGDSFFKGALLLTSKDSSAVLALADGSKVILAEKSTIHFISQNSIHQKSGAIYYEIASRDVKNRLKVSTDFAIIGIKGTSFIVNAAADKNVLLHEGQVGIAKPEGKFALYREKELSEYEQYKAQINKDFKEYKAKQEKEFIAFVKEFDLQEGRMVSFNENRAEDAQMSKNAKEQFQKFKRLIQH